MESLDSRVRTYLRTCIGNRLREIYAGVLPDEEIDVAIEARMQRASSLSTEDVMVRLLVDLDESEFYEA